MALLRLSRWCDCIFELARDIRSDSLRGRSAAWAANPYSTKPREIEKGFLKIIYRSGGCR